MEKCLALIPDVRQRVLVVPGAAGGWTLPEIIPPAEMYNLGNIAAARLVREQWAADVIVLSRVRVPDRQHGALNLLICAPRQTVPRKVEGEHWLERSELDEFLRLEERQRNALAYWFAEAAGENPPGLHIPWWRAGWLEQATAWMQDDVLATHGIALTGEVEQSHSSSTGALLRLPTDQGILYLKALPAPFAREAAVTAALAAEGILPVPTLIASGKEHSLAPGGWILMREFTGEALGNGFVDSVWEESVQRFGAYQAEASRTPQRWLDLDCLDLRLSRFLPRFEMLIASLGERLRGLPNVSVDPGALTATLPYWQRLCEKLASLGISEALVHGDLHAGNIWVTTSGKPIFYDWGFAALSHPFFDLENLLTDDDWFPGRPEMKERLCAFYTAAWHEVDPESTGEAFRLVRQLYPLYLALKGEAVLASFQAMLGGRDYIWESATGETSNAMQWRLQQQLLALLDAAEQQEPEKRGRNLW